MRIVGAHSITTMRSRASKVLSQLIRPSRVIRTTPPQLYIHPKQQQKIERSAILLFFNPDAMYVCIETDVVQREEEENKQKEEKERES